MRRGSSCPETHADLLAAHAWQIGMPGAEEILSATMDHQMNVAGFNVRKFIGTAVDGVDLGPYQAVVEELSKAVDEIERETGAPLDMENEKGWDSLKTKVDVSASFSEP